MATMTEINDELKEIGGDRQVLKVKKIELYARGPVLTVKGKVRENRRVTLGPPYIDLSVPESSIIGDVSELKVGDSIIVNLLAMTDGGPMKALKKKYYFPELEKEVL